jgi:tRNA_anti-like
MAACRAEKRLLGNSGYTHRIDPLGRDRLSENWRHRDANEVRHTMRQLSLFFVLVALSALSLGCPSSRIQDSTAYAPPDGIATATEVWLAFGSNAVQADEKYKGKYLQLAGTIKEITRDPTGEPYVGLSIDRTIPVLTPELEAQLTPEERRWNSVDIPPNVICYLDVGGKAASAAKKPGEKVSILGKCVGSKPDKNVYKGYVVVLEDCVLPSP